MLHALTLLIARQLVNELEDLPPSIEYFVVPPLCPLVGSPYDFSRTSDHIERAIRSTDVWLAQGGLEKSGIPDEMRPHSHERPAYAALRKKKSGATTRRETD